MPDPDRPRSFLDWLGLTGAPDWRLARPLGPLVSVVLALLFLGALTAAFVVLGRTIFGAEANLGTGALIVALLGAPFLIWTTWLKHRNAAHNDASLFNEKIVAATGGLSARRQVTCVWFGKDSTKTILTEWQDDLVARVAAIDWLERLANERPSEVQRVAELLSNYVRVLSREKENLPKSLDTVIVAEVIEWAREIDHKRPDMERAARVLGKLRKVDGSEATTLRIDLRGANLQGFDLTDLDLTGALLSGARMEGANLRRTCLDGAIIGKDANLRGARLDEFVKEAAERDQISLKGTKFSDAILDGADIMGADAAEVVFSKTSLRGANLENALLHNARFGEALMDGKTILRGAKLDGASWKNQDLSMVSISPEQLRKTFGDASVTLPGGVGPDHQDWPEKWPKRDLDGNGFRTEREHWLSNPAGYSPPP